MLYYIDIYIYMYSLYMQVLQRTPSSKCRPSHQAPSALARHFRSRRSSSSRSCSWSFRERGGGEGGKGEGRGGGGGGGGVLKMLHFFGLERAGLLLSMRLASQNGCGWEIWGTQCHSLSGSTNTFGHYMVLLQVVSKTYCRFCQKGSISRNTQNCVQVGKNDKMFHSQ